MVHRRYIAHLREVWKDGLVTPEEAEALETLRMSLNISAEEHFKLEAQVPQGSAGKEITPPPLISLLFFLPIFF